MQGFYQPTNSADPYGADFIRTLHDKMSSIGLDVTNGPNLSLADAGSGDRVYQAGGFGNGGYGLNMGATQPVSKFEIPDLVKPQTSLDPQGLFEKSGGASVPDYTEIDSYTNPSSSKTSRTSDIGTMLRYGRGTSLEAPSLKFGAKDLAEGLGNGINNYYAMRNYGQRRELEMADRKAITDYISANREEASNKRQRELDISHRNYDSALEDPAYGQTPEERKRNALQDAANGWAYMKKVQEGKATNYTQKQQEEGKDAAKLQSFSTRRTEFKKQYGFDPFSDTDMNGRKFSSAQINGFRQYFPGSEFADELSTMERNTKIEQAQANLAGTKDKNEQTQVKTNRLKQTPIPQPRQGGSGKPSTSKTAQVQQMHEKGELTDEEYKRWLLGGNKGPVSIPRGSGFSGRPGGSAPPASKPKAGSRVDSFSSKYGF